MKKLLATIAIAGAVAGCGSATGSQNTAQRQCAKYHAQAQTWAQNYVSDLPAPVSQATVQQLAATSYQADAASHNLVCN